MGQYAGLAGSPATADVEIGASREASTTPKIRDALRTGLEIEIGRTTVAKRTWKRFMKSHWDTLCACDFFSVEALGAFGTVARNMTEPVDGFLRGAKYLIHDHDPLFSKSFIAILEARVVKSVNSSSTI